MRICDKGGFYSIHCYYMLSIHVKQLDMYVTTLTSLRDMQHYGVYALNEVRVKTDTLRQKNYMIYNFFRSNAKKIKFTLTKGQTS